METLIIAGGDIDKEILENCTKRAVRTNYNSC